jgi:hypothetical protein
MCGTFVPKQRSPRNLTAVPMLRAAVFLSDPDAFCRKENATCAIRNSQSEPTLRIPTITSGITTGFGGVITPSTCLILRNGASANPSAPATATTRAGSAMSSWHSNRPDSFSSSRCQAILIDIRHQKVRIGVNHRQLMHDDILSKSACFPQAIPRSYLQSFADSRLDDSDARHAQPGRSSTSSK